MSEPTAALPGAPPPLPYYAPASAGEAVAAGDRFSSLAEAAAAAPMLTADAHAISAMIAGSGPLAGRTLFREVKRLEAGFDWAPAADGFRVEDRRQWTEIAPETSDPADLLEALRSQIATLDARRPLVSLLSGGWDSRLLLALALEARVGSVSRAYTTSSDTGTILEELVASQVAATTGVQHVIVPAERGMFERDLVEFARSAGYLTSFHIWLTPIARTLAADYPAAGPRPLVLDGLGGGLFVGGAFADAGGSPVDARLGGVTKYLAGPQQILRPRAAAVMAEHLRADAEPYVREFLGHPHGHILTAYMTRTWPGISLAPHALIASVADPITPFASDPVMREGLRLHPSAHAGDRLYAQLLEQINPALARIPTAQEQVPWPRPHPRRITSIEAVGVLRNLLATGPVAELIDPEFLASGPTQWRRALETTNGQHLLRGLATLALWLGEYGARLGGFDVTEWTG